MEWKIKTDRMRTQIIRMGLGIIPIKETKKKKKIAHLIWSGHVVRMRDDKTLWAGKLEHRVETPRKTPTSLGRRDTDLKKRGIEWKEVTAMARDCER
jgi:hypothetical protein